MERAAIERGVFVDKAALEIASLGFGGFEGEISKAAEEAAVAMLSPTGLRYSQTTAGGGGKLASYIASMKANGYVGAPIDVVRTGEGFVTIDNTRVMAAEAAGLKKTPAMVHAADEALPASMAGRFGKATTWGEALAYRTGKQKPPLPTTGTRIKPRVPN